ncbi:MAG: PDZ domain-containing protein [Woeseiaceae bacterium]|nr:PDZ domain-containing protein [Woeseiaceae bacterium]
MKMWKIIVPAAAVLLFAGQAAAQTEGDERLRAIEAQELEVEERLRMAEERMAAAAREIAEISKERLPRVARIEERIAMANRPRLGVTIETTDKPGPVEGVKVLGVSPGSAAADVGLRPGDVLTSVNDEALNADTCMEANGRLLDFMKGVEEGDMLTVEYLRNGKVGSVEVEPRVVESRAFVWQGDGDLLHIPSAPMAPEAMERFKVEFAYPWHRSGLGDMELVELNEGLGRYFGTDKGLLVVRAPKSDAFDIRDGDVIQDIDGREPKDTRHAMRILGSYSSGEQLKLGIMRDKRRVTVDVEIPADYRGSLAPDAEFLLRPVVAPAVTPVIAPAVSPAAPRATPAPQVAPVPEVVDPTVEVDVIS